MNEHPEERIPAMLAALGAGMDNLCAVAYQRIVRELNEEEGLATFTLILAGDEQVVSTRIDGSLVKVKEIQRREVESRREEVTAYLIAYDGGWMDAMDGEQRAIFVEMETNGVSDPIRFAQMLVRDKSGRLTLAEKAFSFHPAYWSSSGLLDMEAEGLEVAKLTAGNAELRKRIKPLKDESKTLKHIPLSMDYHPKFETLGLRIQRGREDNSKLKRQIEFLQGQISRGEQPALWLYDRPDDNPRPPVPAVPEAEETLAELKDKLVDLAARMRHHRWRHLWHPGRVVRYMGCGWLSHSLASRLRAIAEAHKDMELHVQLCAQIQAAVCVKELREIERQLIHLEQMPPLTKSCALRIEQKSLIADERWLVAWNKDRRNKQEKWAAEPLDDETYCAQRVADLEAQIGAFDAENAGLKAQIRELEQVKVNDPPSEWCQSLSTHTWIRRGKRPIVDRRKLTPEQEWQCCVIGGYIIAWWEHRYREIVGERRILSFAFKTAEPWHVIFTSDMPGLVAAETVFVRQPRGYTYLFDDEYLEWIAKNPDPEFAWHFHVWSRFTSVLAPDDLKRARTGFPAVPPDQFRLHCVGEMWGSLAGNGQDHLWQWDGNEARLLEERFNGWVS